MAPLSQFSTSSAESHIRRFTAAAIATGAVPVPGASVALVAENAVMVAAIASAMGVEVSMATVVKAYGAAGAVNVFGRTVFVEAARAMGWFGGPLGVPGVMALGAATAGLQTWTVGQLALAVCLQGGRPLGRATARRVLREARASYESGEFSGATRSEVRRVPKTRRRGL